MPTTVALAIGGLITTTALVSVPTSAGAATSAPVKYTTSRTVTVPSTACRATFVVIGASGVDGSPQAPTPAGGTGGLGAKVTATIPVVPASHLQIAVGGGGGSYGSGLGFNGGTGGGYSAVSINTGATPVIVAGGGGGGGAGGPGHDGGPGGNAGSEGSDGFHMTTGTGPGETASGGQPGTQHAGGAAGTDTAAPDGDLSAGAPGPTAGGLLAGGLGGSNGDGGGGGGGGYYGGGGGAGGYDSSGAGGGGGSSLVPAGGSVTTATTAGPGSVSVTWINSCRHERPALKVSSPIRGYFLAKVHTHPVLRRAFVAIVTIRHGHATVVGDVRTNSHGAAAAMFPAKRGSKIKVQARTTASPNTIAGKSATKTVRIHR
jgi:hypothetical protein